MIPYGEMRMETEVNKELLESLVQEVNTIPPMFFPAGLMQRRIKEDGFYEETGLRFDKADYAVSQLYAGLAVLARDMHLYLSENSRDDAALFEEVISLVNAEEREKHGSRAFPSYTGLPTEDLPKHLASAAALGQPTVITLKKQGIVHEWTVKPGKRLLKKFGTKLKAAICGREGPYEKFNEGLIGQANLPAGIASQILLVGFSAATFWYPLAVYMSILFINAGLKTFCEPD